MQHRIETFTFIYVCNENKFFFHRWYKVARLPLAHDLNDDPSRRRESRLDEQRQAVLRRRANFGADSILGFSHARFARRPLQLAAAFHRQEDFGQGRRRFVGRAHIQILSGMLLRRSEKTLLYIHVYLSCVRKVRRGKKSFLITTENVECAAKRSRKQRQQEGEKVKASVAYFGSSDGEQKILCTASQWTSVNTLNRLINPNGYLMFFLHHK